MGLGWTLIIVAAIVIVIWVVVEFKRFRHKFFAIFLIILIIFSYLSFVVVLKGKDIDFKSPEGLKVAGKLYFVWLKSVFSNIKIITSNAIHMDWSAEENITEIKTKTTTKTISTSSKSK